MIAAWLLFASVLFALGRRGWFSLAICAAIVAVKRPEWSLELIALVVTMGAFAVGWHLWQHSKQDASQRLGWAAAVLLWGLWGATVWASYVGTRCGRPPTLDAARPIVCLGDSLTTGLSDDEAYPAYLQELVRTPVVNLGRAGITARDATAFLPRVLDEKPQVVIVELGGHDYLRGYGRAATRDSLVTIIEACQQAGAAVVLFETPRGFISDPLSGLERELARTYDLELIPDTAIRMLVLRSTTFPLAKAFVTQLLSDDGLHPNVAGARHLAEVVHRSLAHMYGPEIDARNR